MTFQNCVDTLRAVRELFNLHGSSNESVLRIGSIEGLITPAEFSVIRGYLNPKNE